MALNFNQVLDKSLNAIQHKKYYSINVDNLETYGEAKWEIVDLLNSEYDTTFNHYNWINHNTNDEIAYFINECGSNTLNYSQFKSPSKFHLWLGEKGFIIGIEQEGKGFNAHEIDKLQLKQNEGAGFEFYRKCKNKIFFDNAKDAKIVFMKYLL
jgi:hypothetical protein